MMLSSSNLPFRNSDDGASNKLCFSKLFIQYDLSPEASATIQSSSEITPSPAVDCPYKTGAKLTLVHDDEVINAQIAQVYRGTPDFQFSNSCTVLLSISSSNVQSMDGVEQAVLKIMDWRYMSLLRARYHCEEWRWKQVNDDMAITAPDPEVFTQWLYSDMTEEEMKDSDIRNLCQETYLPPKPSHMDLFRHLLSLDENQNEQVDSFVKKKILLSTPTIEQRKTFLRIDAQVQVAYEVDIARIITREVPGYTPQTYGIFTVAPSCITRAINDTDDETIYGHLMAKVNGKPIALSKDSGLGKWQIDTLARQVASFQLQLLRCNLQIWDDNPHNFMLDMSIRHKPTISVVDYSAIGSVHPVTEIIKPPSITLPLSNIEIQLPASYYSQFFYVNDDRTILGALLGPLGLDHYEQYYALEVVAPRYLFAEVDTLEKVFVWQSIMLHLVHSCEQQTLSTHAQSILDFLQRARTIMKGQNVIPSLIPWWKRVTQKIASETEDDPDRAQSLTEKSLEIVRRRDGQIVDLDEYDVYDPLALLLIPKSTSNQVCVPDLLFPNFNSKILKSQADSPPYLPAGSPAAGSPAGSAQDA